MGDVIFVDFHDKRKEFKFIDPQSKPEIIHLDACLKETIRAITRCSGDKQWIQAHLVTFQDILDKCMKDIK